MRRELLVLRHGKSDWDAGSDDFHRPLNMRGQQTALQVGNWLAEQRLIPDHLVSSPAERALATALRAANTMGIGATEVVRESRLYAADTGELLEVLRESPGEARRVMIVGHNPGLEALVRLLADTDVRLPSDGKLLPTATVARLSLAGDWRDLGPSGARLESITRPDEMPSKFPYPGPDGKELRDRPAYYYTQSAVIPYRLRDGTAEILVITSRKKRHWVIPKGIQEPGLSAQESAALEALEEAGVAGEIADAPLGRYQYRKWGASCTVEVYPMRVTQELPEQDRKEPERAREWVSPKQAIQRLKSEALQSMIRRLSDMLKPS